MADETKKPEDQKPTILEPPKDIEELLKELPKVAPQTAPPSPRASADTAKPTMPPAIKPPLPIQSERSSATESRIRDLPAKPSGLGQVGTKPLSPPTPQTDKFKSLVRTMAEDLEAAKKGIKPESKPFEIKPPPDGPKITPPAPPIPSRPTMPEMKLGPAERTKPMEMPKTPPALPPLAGMPTKKPTFSPKLLILIILILTAFGTGWWYLQREPEKIVAPLPTPSPTPSQKTIYELFGPPNQVTISSTENFLTALNNRQLRDPNQNGFTSLTLKDENERQYALSEIFQKLQISIPGELLENLDPNEWLLVAYGQQEMFDEKGLLIFSQVSKTKLGLIAKTTNPDFLRSILNNWEPTMTNDLKGFLGINPAKATSQTFLDNIYGGADVRYRNFPYADNAIDYAIVNLPQFNLGYFVLTNSRESIYSAIDLLRQ